MEFGVCLPYAKAGLDRRLLLDWMRAIDDGPFAAVSCGERVTGDGVDMRIALAAAAAVTERVRIHPTLYILPMHDAVRAAKEIATLDVIADGRLEVTVGVGGREFDYRSVGASFARRWQRQDDQVAQMRAVWAGESPVAEATVIGPRPVQSGGPPVHAGVMGPKAMARAARWADGVYLWSGNGEEAEMAAFVEMARQAWADAGRTEPPKLIGGFWYSLSPHDPEGQLRRYVYDYLAFLGHDLAELVASTMTRSTPAAVAEGIANLQRAGCDDIYLVPATAELAEVERAAPLVS